MTMDDFLRGLQIQTPNDNRIDTCRKVLRKAAEHEDEMLVLSLAMCIDGMESMRNVCERVEQLAAPHPVSLPQLINESLEQMSDLLAKALLLMEAPVMPPLSELQEALRDVCRSGPAMLTLLNMTGDRILSQQSGD